MAVILKDLKAHSHLNYDSKCIYMIVLPANTVRLFLRNAASVGLEGGTCLRVCNSTTQMFLWARREESLICYRSKKEFRNTVALQLNHSKEEVFACPNLWKLWKGMASLFIHRDSFLILDPQMELFPSLHLSWGMWLYWRAWQSQNTVPGSFKSKCDL